MAVQLNRINQTRRILRALSAFDKRNVSSPVVRQVSGNTKDEVLTEQRGEVFLIGINRAEKRNCVNPETAKKLFTAFRHFEKQEAAKVAVLYGVDGVFCAGFDLSALSKMEGPVSLPKEPVQELEGPMGPSRLFIQKPVIAAVEGYAVAGGLELACLCDLRVVAESAVMGVFCRRFGVPLIDGGTVRLPQLIGLSRALDLILTGRPVKATEALQIGLANRVVPTGTALTEAILLAKEIAKFPQQCMLADRKSAFYSTYDAKNNLDALQYEFENGIQVVQLEAIQGASRFVKGEGKHGNFKDLSKSKL